MEHENRVFLPPSPNVAICILISTGERFHGQYREIYRGAVCDDILPACLRARTVGPTHGGAPTPPHTFGTVGGRGGSTDREAEEDAV